MDLTHFNLSQSIFIESLLLFVQAMFGHSKREARWELY